MAKSSTKKTKILVAKKTSSRHDHGKSEQVRNNKKSELMRKALGGGGGKHELMHTPPGNEWVHQACEAATCAEKEFMKVRIKQKEEAEVSIIYFEDFS
mgnify:CR=1 FL=1